MADTTATIDPRTGVLTLINVYDVEPAKLGELADALRDMTDRSIRHQPGFIPVCIHVSFDGEKVVNFAQWQSKEHFKGFMKGRRPLHPTGVQIDGLKFHGRRSSIRLAGWPDAIASTVALR